MLSKPKHIVNSIYIYILIQQVYGYVKMCHVENNTLEWTTFSVIIIANHLTNLRLQSSIAE